MDLLLKFVEALAWPLVAVLALIIFRLPLLELLGEIIRRARKLSVYEVSIELATVPALTPRWSVPEIDVRQLSSADLIDSYTETLFRQISEPTDAEYAIVDLGGGRQWLTSRLFIFALVLGEITGLRAIVFLEKSGLCRKTFLGVATPSVVWKTLAERYPWFQEAFVRATVPLLPPPPEDKAGTSLITGPVTTFPTSNPAQLKDIARSYVAALQRRTDPPEDEKRDHQPLKPKISGGPTWEKATWITGDLLEQLLGAKLSDDWCVEALDKPQSALVESILKRNDDFVALVDGRHKFRGLVDRKALASQAWKTRDHERTVSAGGSN